MKRHLLILSLILVFFNCQKKEANKGFTINGTITGDVPEKIFISYYDHTDSSLIKDNKFYFSGSAPFSLETQIYTSNASAFLEDYIYIENTDIDLKLNIKKKKSGSSTYDLISIDTLLGTQTEPIRIDFKRFKDSIIYNKNRKQLLLKKVKNIIKENPKNNYSAYLIYINSDDFTKQEIHSLIKMIDTSFISKSQLENLKRISNPDRILKIGSKIADFTLNNYEGKVENTKDLRGKILLIDFWASWCKPCRKKHPKLKEIYNKFKDDDFEILSVSIDKDVNKWKRAIDHDSLPWLNVIETQEYQGDVALRYNILGLPTTYVVDKKGVITNIDMPLDDLEQYLLDNLNNSTVN